MPLPCRCKDGVGRPLPVPGSPWRESPTLRIDILPLLRDDKPFTRRLAWISAQLGEQNLTGEAQPGRAGARHSPGTPALPRETPTLQLGPGEEDRSRDKMVVQGEHGLPQALRLRVLHPARVCCGKGSAHAGTAIGPEGLWGCRRGQHSGRSSPSVHHRGWDLSQARCRAGGHFGRAGLGRSREPGGQQLRSHGQCFWAPSLPSPRWAGERSSPVLPVTGPSAARSCARNGRDAGTAAARGQLRMTQSPAAGWGLWESRG